MPDFRNEIRQRPIGLNLPPARAAEITKELSQHLEDQDEQALSRGATEEKAHLRTRMRRKSQTSA